MSIKWPEGSTVKTEPSIRAWGPKQSKPEFLCHVTFPAPASAGIRKLYISGRGECDSTWYAHGYGPDAFQAEEAAYKKFQEITTCEHDWHREAVVDHEAGRPLAYQLDGDATCNKCGLYQPFKFMDDSLHRSMCLAHRAHEGQKRKYSGEPYINHPKMVYTRVAFWNYAKIPYEQRVKLGCAAWLHDVKEDCPHISDEEIVAAAGPEVFALIGELTNPSKGVKAPRAVRKQMDRDHLAVVSHDAKIIKLIDRICNLQDMRGCDEMDFLALYARESRQLWEVLREADLKLAAELLNVIEQCERRANGGAV